VPKRRPMTFSAAVGKRRREIETPVIERDASADEVLDVAVQYTFPASDPIAIEKAYEARLKRNKSHGRS
jgi:hypothetical protein